MQLNNKASGEPATNGFEAWFFGEGDPKAAIVYPQCHFWFSVKNSSKWCGFIKFESIVNNSVSEPVLTDTEEGLVNEEVSFQKSVFSVPFMVGYHDSQFIRITVYDGDQMRLHQGYCMASVKIPLSEVTKATSEFSLCRGDKELAKLYVHTTLDKVTKVMKLFSPDPIISLNFSDTAPDEAKLRKQHEFFNENMNFYVFKFNSPNLIDYDKKFLKSLSGYYFYLKMTKGMKDSDGEIIPAGTKDLWRSRNLDSPPFKLKVGGITRSHEDLTGFVDTRTKPDDLLCLVLELYFVSKDGEEMCVARCDIKLREIIDLPTDEKRTFTGNLVSTYQINPDQDRLSGSNGYEIRSDGISVVDEGLDSEGEVTDLNDEVKTPKSSYSLRSFVSRKLSIRSSASNVNENNSVRECVQKLCKKFGTIQIKVKKQVNLQKVGCGNELYEDRVSAIVEHVRARWYLRLLDVFEQAVFRRRLESIRYIHFLQRINAGWCMKTKIVTDMYHPCLQNIVSQVNRQRGKSSNLLMTSNKSCKVLDVTSLYFSTIQPFLRNQELSAIAGGWITLPSPRFSRFTMDSHFEETGVDIKDKGQNEAIDEYFVRNVGFPIAQEYLACSGSAIQVDDLLPIQIIKSITSWLYGSASKRDGDNEFNLSDLETTQPVNSIFATPNSSDPQHLIRNWAQKVSRDRLYAKRIKYRDSSQLIQGFMEASGIYFPAQQMIDSVQVKRNKSDVPQSINQINQFRKNETRRIACYTGTDYDIELNPTQLSFLSDLPKTSISGKKDRSFDLDTLHFLLNEKVSDKELNIVTWVLGRSPPTSEQKKFRALMSQHLWREKHPSVLLIILAAEQRYDITNTDKDMLSKIADPFADFLNWYNDSLQPPETKKDDESESGDASKNIAFNIASTLGILPVKDVNAKVAVLHYVTWAEIMARSYQLDDIERQRLKMRRDQEDQQNMGKAEHEADSNLNPLSDSQLPTVMSLKEILMSIFSVEVAEKILGQRVEDWLPGESADMLNDGKSQRCDGSNISQRDVEVMSGASHVENEIRSATDQSSVGKINAQVLAHMKQYIRVNDNPSEDGHSVTSHAKIDRDKSPHFVAKKDLIKEIKSFHELNKIKDRFDTEMQALMKRQLDDQVATFLLAFDYNDEEYQEYEGKLRPIY